MNFFSNLFEILFGLIVFCVGNLSKLDEIFFREISKFDEMIFGGVWICVNGLNL